MGRDMANPLLLPEIRQMIAEKDEEGLSEIMDELHPASVAEFAEGMSVEETWELLSHGDEHRQALVFPFFSPAKEVAGDSSSDKVIGHFVNLAKGHPRFMSARGDPNQGFLCFFSCTAERTRRRPTYTLDDVCQQVMHEY